MSHFGQTNSLKMTEHFLEWHSRVIRILNVEILKRILNIDDVMNDTLRAREYKFLRQIRNLAKSEKSHSVQIAWSVDNMSWVVYIISNFKKTVLEYSSLTQILLKSYKI